MLHAAPTPGVGVEAYAAFAAALARRYGPGGEFWRAHPQLTYEPVRTFEIWNEPDGGFWLPAPNPAAYAQLYLRARQAIHAVQPSAQVIVGGLSHPTSTLPAMLAAVPRLRGLIDGVGIHPYASTPGGVFAKVAAARATMTSLGLGSVPLYVTEFGWSTHGGGDDGGVPDQLRLRYIGQVIDTLAHSNCGVAATVLYTWVTPEQDPAQKEQWFGIAPPSGGSGAGVQTFANAVKAARSGSSTVRLC